MQTHKVVCLACPVMEASNCAVGFMNHTYWQNLAFRQPKPKLKMRFFAKPNQSHILQTVHP